MQPQQLWKEGEIATTTIIRKGGSATTTITNGGRVCNHINCERREGVQSQEFLTLTTQIYFR